MGKTIDIDVLNLFITKNEETPTNKRSTYLSEMQIAVGMAADCFVLYNHYAMCLNPDAFSSANKDPNFGKIAYLLPDEIDALKRRLLRKLQLTAKKIVWLNSKCKNIDGQQFVVDLINVQNPRETYPLIQDFYLAFIRFEKTSVQEDIFLSLENDAFETTE
jgi:hypothetical protein